MPAKEIAGIKGDGIYRKLSDWHDNGILLGYIQEWHLAEFWPFAKQNPAFIIIYSFINMLRFFSKCEQIVKFAKKD
jgi:hypothetical protein